MRHVAQFLADVYNGSIMASHPTHRDIGPEQVTLHGSDTSGVYRVTMHDLVQAEEALRYNPRLGDASLGLESPHAPVPLLEKIANWYAEQLGLI